MKRIGKCLVATFLSIAMVFGLVPLMSNEVEAASVTITFDYGAGASSPYKANVKTEKKTFTSGKVKMPAPYRPSNVDFLGWSETKWGTVKYTYGNTYNITKSMTLYARYKCNGTHYSDSKNQTVIRNATCTVEGVANRICLYCGASYTATLPKLSKTGTHSYKVLKVGEKTWLSCTVCGENTKKSMVLNDFAKCWNAAGKGIGSYKGSESDAIKAAWVSYSFDLPLSEATSVYAYYVCNSNYTSKIKLVCQDANKVKKFIFGVKSLDTLSSNPTKPSAGVVALGKDLSKTLSKVYKRACIVDALVNPNLTSLDRAKKLGAAVSPASASITMSMEMMIDAVEHLAYAETTDFYMTQIATAIYNVMGTNEKGHKVWDYRPMASEGYTKADQITSVELLENLDDICREFTKDNTNKTYARLNYTDLCKYKDKPEVKAEYLAIQHAIYVSIDRDFKEAFPGCGNFKTFVAETKKAEKRATTAANIKKYGPGTINLIIPYLPYILPVV